MEISSSSDSQPVENLAASLTWRVAEAEIQLDSVTAHVKEVKKTIMFIKDAALTVHSNHDESRREDILCFQMIMETIVSKLKDLDSTLADMNKDIDERMAV